VAAFPDRKSVSHKARIAAGTFAASTGWPSLAATQQHDFLDWPARGQRVGWNVMDFWKREGDKLSENWVLIDLIDAANTNSGRRVNRLLNCQWCRRKAETACVRRFGNSGRVFRGYERHWYNQSRVEPMIRLVHMKNQVSRKGDA
jgi:hypothetical protein